MQMKVSAALPRALFLILATACGTTAPAPARGSDGGATGGRDGGAIVPTCIPGAVLSCACENGTSGAQACDANGTLGECRRNGVACASPAAGPDGGADDGGGDGADGGTVDGGAPLFAGTCLEPLYRCFRATGEGTCSYLGFEELTILSFPNGANIYSNSNGAGFNRCSGAPASPGGAAPLCMDVYRITVDGGLTWRIEHPGNPVPIATVTELASGGLRVTCPGASDVRVPTPDYNPSFEDMRRCVPPGDGG